MVRLEEPIAVPRIETKRLILRGLSENDIPFLFEHFSKEEINKYSSDENITSMEEAKRLYEKYIVPKPALFRLGLVVKENGELIGTIGFYGIDRTNMRAIVGADLMREHWGKGFMTEALQALISYGFSEMRLNRIEATADPQNLRAVKLMERCDFKKEGVLRERYYCKASFHDDAIYSLLKKEWRNGQ